MYVIFSLFCAPFILLNMCFLRLSRKVLTLRDALHCNLQETRKSFYPGRRTTIASVKPFPDSERFFRRVQLQPLSAIDERIFARFLAFWDAFTIPNRERLPQKI